MKIWLPMALSFAAGPFSSRVHQASIHNEPAIQAIIHEQQEAWNRGDAKGFSAHFAGDGSFTNIVGMQSYGIEPFIKQHEHIFATIYKGSQIEMTVGKLRFIRPDVVVADVDAVVTKVVSLPPGIFLGSDGGLHTKIQLVLSKEQNGWQIDAFHNVAVNPAIGNDPPR